MSKEEKASKPATDVENDDEPDDWDKRIFSTGCATENTKMNDCFFEKKDWRKCKSELEGFKACWKRQQNDQRTQMKDAGVAAQAQSTSISYPLTDFAFAYLQHNNNVMASRAGRLVSSGIIEASSLPLRLQRYGLRSNSPTSQRYWNPSSTHIRHAATATATANNVHKPAPITAKIAPATKPPIAASFSQSNESLPPTQDLRSGLEDEPLILDEGERQVDWTRSFHGLSAQPFSKEAADILLAPVPVQDVECKPDGIIYLPEIKYRRILNRAFGPGGWGLAPRGETIVTSKSITREYALVAHGRLVSVARGEQDYFSPDGIPTATEGCKSNALMRCCKDLGVASELWDPRYIRVFMKENAKQVWVEHTLSKKRKQIWLRKDDEVRYPFKETKFKA